ncbi:MAG: hypothetical protein EOO88_60170 [Pedobacter sp.]|nr:MAG: hypothetical protein EOO88_60170 [Pedobacter sp.]
MQKFSMPLFHYHYDRFDTPNDETDGFFSLNFYTNSQGDVDRFEVSMDEGQVIFTRKADASLATVETLQQYVGKYQAGSTIIEMAIKNENELFAILPGQPQLRLLPSKPRIFKTKDFADLLVEFVVEGNAITGFKQKDPSGEYLFKKVTSK